MKKVKKSKSNRTPTFESEMQGAKFKTGFEQNFIGFALQELLAAMSHGDEKSVRSLAKAAGMNPNSIQNLRSGKTFDIRLTSLLKIARVHGYELELVKDDVRIPIAPRTGKLHN